MPRVNDWEILERNRDFKSQIDGDTLYGLYRSESDPWDIPCFELLGNLVSFFFLNHWNDQKRHGLDNQNNRDFPERMGMTSLQPGQKIYPGPGSTWTVVKQSLCHV